MKLKLDDEIVLKSFELNDVEKRYKVIDNNRKFLIQWLSWLDLYKDSNDLKKYTKICQERERNKQAYALGIYHNGEFAGSIEIQNIDYRNKKCEIGYWLAEEFTHKGIMMRSCIEIINYVFNNIQLNKINILAATENYSSQAIPEKLNFIKEGMLEDNECLYGVFVDNYIYGMTRKRWKNGQNERV